MTVATRVASPVSRAGFPHHRDSSYVDDVVGAYAEPGRYVDTSILRGGENRAAGRRERRRQRGVEPEEAVRMPGPEQHRRARGGGRGQPLREGVERGDGQ